ncbi:lipopolysaccharide transport system ATP-binding protein [Enhydrobacter aerosaccus]|uniref:Lipopolysaccharide transport system ATP-binding protein n=1 Tax=Enhydrobacter aerosaccus TaxID=225324 RepID=A0A1T4TBD3_9HYPH|nr:ABC transporter ATP-binding protein [Enhydrobacter aerosaccus]SKA37880.1 lipopolysaccharide transport system ATP-binding protein [Enhydrobacter aerosaccus]
MSSEKDVVIRARHLAKAYRIYGNQQQRLKQVLFGSWHTYYRSFWALKDISFEVRRGEALGILGRNGCGKSTLLQIACGMIRPTKGEIMVNGRIAPVLALGGTFDAESTGRQNVLIGGAVLGLKRHEILEKMDSIADFAGIGDFMGQPVKFYSSGMRVRLAFAICAHIDPEILVVDEALAVGDAVFQRKCMDWIDNFRRRGTLLFVSHATSEVARLCNNAIWIDDGRIREAGTPANVIRAYRRATLIEQDNMRRFSAM